MTSAGFPPPGHGTAQMPAVPDGSRPAKRILRPSAENLGNRTSGGGEPPESTGDRGAPESTGITQSRPSSGAEAKASQRPSGENFGSNPHFSRSIGGPNVPSGFRCASRTPPLPFNKAQASVAPSGDQVASSSCAGLLVRRVKVPSSMESSQMSREPARVEWNESRLLSGESSGAKF